MKNRHTIGSQASRLFAWAIYRCAELAQLRDASLDLTPLRGRVNIEQLKHVLFRDLSHRSR